MPKARSKVISRTLAAALALAAMPLGGESGAPDRTVVSIQEFIGAGNYAEASRRLDAAMAAYPSDAGLLNLRGVIHAQKNEMADARKDFEWAVKLAPGLIPAWQNLARACQIGMEGDATGGRCAAEAWLRVLNARPGDVEARMSLAAVFERQGKYGDSLRELRGLPAGETGRAPSLALRCADLAGLGRYGQAEETARRLTKAAEFSEADVAPILPAFGKNGGATVVVTLVEGLEAHGGASEESLRQLVAAYERLNRLSDARKTLEALAARDPRNPRHLLELARVAYLEHDFEGALGYLGHARDLTPGDARVHFLFGMVLVEMNLPMEARRSVEKAVALDPRNPDYNYGLGSIILRARDAASAAASFRKYVEERPEDPRGHFALGVAYFAAGDYERCRSEMSGIRDDPATAAGAGYFLGRVARIDEKLDEAAALLEGSIRLSPSFAEAYAELGRVRLRQGRTEEAKAAVERALSLDRDSYQANGTLLAIYQRTRDPRAEEQNERLKKLDEVRSKQQELMLRSVEVKPY